MNTEKQIMFSLITGDIYTILSDEIKNMDEYQVPLKKRPLSNCKKCFGRFYTGRHLKHNLFIMCSKCSPKCVDIEKVKSLIVNSNQSTDAV